MAGSTRLEGKPGVSDIGLGVGQRGVALGAGHCCVRSRQREFRRCVIKSRSRLPGSRCVALCTVRTELSSMLILMAPDTGIGEPQIGVI